MPNSTESLRAKLLEALEQSDNWRRQDRAGRILWLSQHQPAYGLISGPMDTMAVLAQARDCFVEGHYIATLLLAVAFLEHVLMDELKDRHLEGKVGNFSDAIKRAKQCKLFPDDLLSRVDALRKIRNPFAHRTAPDHKHGFGTRFKARGVHPQIILEEDARESLELMYAFFRLTLKRA